MVSHHILTLSLLLGAVGGARSRQYGGRALPRVLLHFTDVVFVAAALSWVAHSFVEVRLLHMARTTLKEYHEREVDLMRGAASRHSLAVLPRRNRL
ncbi:hypothetical protein BS78_03G273900 [Paspalum vaginatum]|nr:hypothetical protein BS78_03G273900 [Paspalum vaginatum]